MTRFSPWQGNPLRDRGDVMKAHDEIFNPLIDAFSNGCARVRISQYGSSCTEAAAEFEGFLRPLWGIVPYVYGGGEFKHWAMYRKGLVNGCNPQHEEYWGTPNNFDQILVDIAAIGFALCFVPQHIWEPLLGTEKKIVSDYLILAADKEFCHNNWKFFKVLVDLGLENVGVKVDKTKLLAYLDDLESFYLDEGWYGDGKTHRIDYYNPFAFHFYSLIYVKLQQQKDSERCIKYLNRAKVFAKQFVYWFSEDGASVPYGRSLIYRFGVIGFWGILATVLDRNEEPPVPWGVMKGIYLRHLQWWSQQPIFHLGSKILTLGYSYPNDIITERYNSPQSPYWANKAFSALFIPEEHPFWSSDPLPLSLSNKYLPIIGMYFIHTKKNSIALINGPWNDEYQTEKYTKFAYSTKFGFGIISNHRTFTKAHLDNLIGFSIDNREFYVRENYEAWYDGEILISKWVAFPGLSVETWIIPKENFHIRVHRIKNDTDVEVKSKEGGFAISVNDAVWTNDKGQSKVESPEVFSLIKSLDDSRKPNVCQSEPNTNLLFPRAVIPELIGTIAPKSEARFACAVIALEKSETFKETFDYPSSVKPLTRVLCNETK